jgi:hypothetical protein
MLPSMLAYSVAAARDACLGRGDGQRHVRAGLVARPQRTVARDERGRGILGRDSPKRGSSRVVTRDREGVATYGGVRR